MVILISLHQSGLLWESDPDLPSTLKEIKEEAVRNWNDCDSESLPQNVLLSPYQVLNCLLRSSVIS